MPLRWVPSHKKIEGNEQADKAAKQAAITGRVKIERWSSLSHISTKIRETSKEELHQWHCLREDERHTTRRGWFVTRMKSGIDSTLGKTQKKYAARFCQLKVGHAAVVVFLKRIGVNESESCWWCGAAEQSVHHIYTRCRKWRRERRNLKKELVHVGIKWQRRPEMKWLANLLANEQALQPLLDFLKSTEVKIREGAAERDEEWEMRNDLEGEETLGG